MKRLFYKTILFVSVLFFFHSSTVSAQCNPVLRNDTLQWQFDGVVSKIVQDTDRIYLAGSYTTMMKNTGSMAVIDTTTANIRSLSWPKINGNIYAIVPDGSGGVIVGGSFTSVGSVVRKNLAQITSSGTVSSWAPNPNNTVAALGVYGSTLYVGGAFDTISATQRHYLSSYTLGSMSLSSWNPNPNGNVNTIYIGDSIGYVGGTMTSFGVTTRYHIGAFNLNTGNLTSFAPNANNYVISIQKIGTTVYIGGQFTTLNGSTRNYIGAVDTGGTLTSWNPNANSPVLCFYPNSSSTILVGGQYSSIGGQTRAGFAELSLTTGNATGLNMNFVYPGYNPIINTIYAISNKIYVGGNYTYVQGFKRNGFCCIDLTKDSVTNFDALPNYNSNPGATTVYAIGNIGTNLFVGGIFDHFGRYRNSLSAIDIANDTLLSWDPKLSSTAQVNDIIVDGNQLFIAGGFSSVNGVTRYGLAAFNKKTFVVNPNLNDSFPTLPNCMVLSGKHLYIGGGGTGSYVKNINKPTSGSIPFYGAVAVDTASGTVLGWNPQLYFYANPGYVLTMVAKDDKIYIGGMFSKSNSTIRKNIALVDTVGSGTLSAWNPRADSTVRQISLQGNSLYVLGAFDSIGHRFIPKIAKFYLPKDTADTWSPYPTGYSGGYGTSAQCIAFVNNLAYVGGNFNAVYGSADTNLAAIDTSTASPTSWQPRPSGSIGNVVTVSVFGNRLYAGGNFLSMAGNPEYYYASFNLQDVPPVVNISTPNTTICSGTAISIAATPYFSGGSYQWKKNGTNVGTGGMTYSFTPSNGDSITCVLTMPSSSCYSGTSFTSNYIKMVVNSYVAPSITITASKDTLCTGATVKDTLTSNAVGATYQWKKNGTSVGTGANTYSFTPTSGDKVYCIMTVPAGGCFTGTTANSDTLTSTVLAYLSSTSHITITKDTVCSGTSVTLSDTTNIVGGSYQWNVNGINVGTGTTSYSYTPVNGDSIICSVNAVTGCYTPSLAVSNKIKMKVLPKITPISYAYALSDTVCTGASTSLFDTTNAKGCTYQWYLNGTNTGITTFFDSYAPSNGDKVSCIITVPSTGCWMKTTVISDTVTMTVLPNTTPTISISGNTSGPVGGTIALHATVSNASSSYSITWKNKGVNLVITTVPDVTYIKGPGTDTITAMITPTGPGCYNSATSNAWPVQVGLAVSNFNNQEDNISIYPNPFKQEITVSNLQANDNVFVYDVMGRTTGIQFVANKEGENTFYIQNLSAGMYIIRITDKAGNIKANRPLQKL